MDPAIPPWWSPDGGRGFTVLRAWSLAEPLVDLGFVIPLGTARGRGQRAVRLGTCHGCRGKALARCGSGRVLGLPRFLHDGRIWDEPVLVLVARQRLRPR